MFLFKDNWLLFLYAGFILLIIANNCFRINVYENIKYIIDEGIKYILSSICLLSDLFFVHIGFRLRCIDSTKCS